MKIYKKLILTLFFALCSSMAADAHIHQHETAAVGPAAVSVEVYPYGGRYSYAPYCPPGYYFGPGYYGGGLSFYFGPSFSGGYYGPYYYSPGCYYGGPYTYRKYGRHRRH